ncbi:hypothetical protein YW7DRAFT_04509 [Streptomyces sp. AmelKG-E11A]|nr:hypothetical protein YW7DRAFT_04509 [Streptomyces sp. AmelKG-E11A]
MGPVAEGFGVGEDRGESGPVRVVEDAVRVFGNRDAHVAGDDPPADLRRLAPTEFGEHGRKGSIGSGLEVVEGLPGRFGLVGVALRLVPATGNDRGPDEGGDQGGQRAAVGASGGVDDVAGRRAEGVGGPVLGTDRGSLGPCEGSCGVP